MSTKHTRFPGRRRSGAPAPGGLAPWRAASGRVARRRAVVGGVALCCVVALLVGGAGAVAYASPVGWSTVSAGGLHTCGVRTDGTLACWGHNDIGQATPPEGTFIQVGGGNLHSWRGADGRHPDLLGVHGDGQAEPPEGTFIQVSAGGFHSCPVPADRGRTPAVGAWHRVSRGLLCHAGILGGAWDTLQATEWVEGSHD